LNGESLKVCEGQSVAEIEYGDGKSVAINFLLLRWMVRRYTPVRALDRPSLYKFSIGALHLGPSRGNFGPK
jgi:hypothetical protein